MYQYGPTARGAQRLAASQRAATQTGFHHPPAIESAQRLAASQRARHPARHDPRRPTMCSTPCGITEVGTDQGRVAVPLVECSTPCGITEVGTASVSRASGVDPDGCSTPCGITEGGTRGSPRAPAPVTWRAQRLAASQRSALRKPGPIAGRATRSAQRLAASLRAARQPRPAAVKVRCSVLNALRHH